MKLQAHVFVQMVLLTFAFTLSANVSATQQFFTDFSDFTADGSSVLGGQTLGDFVIGNSQDASLFTVAGVPVTFSGGVNGTGHKEYSIKGFARYINVLRTRGWFHQGAH